MKDYFDLWILAGHAELDRTVLQQAIEATFLRRYTQIPVGTPLGLFQQFGIREGPACGPVPWNRADPIFIQRARPTKSDGELSLAQDVRRSVAKSVANKDEDEDEDEDADEEAVAGGGQQYSLLLHGRWSYSGQIAALCQLIRHCCAIDASCPGTTTLCGARQGVIWSRGDGGKAAAARPRMRTNIVSFRYRYRTGVAYA